MWSNSTRFVTMATTLDLFRTVSLNEIRGLSFEVRLAAKAASVLALKTSASSVLSSGGNASFPATLSFILIVSRGFFWPLAPLVKSFRARSECIFAAIIFELALPFRSYFALYSLRGTADLLGRLPPF